MTSTLRVVAVAGLLGFLAMSGQGQARQEPTPPQPAQTPTFRTGINFVRVDVVVTGKDGRQVSDLNVQDFDVTEGGKRQKIETFKLIALDGAPGVEGAPASISSDAVEEDEAKRDEVRMFAIFLDDYHVSPASGRVVREQLARLVETELGPTDLVGLMYPLTSLDSVRMSRNRDAVANTIRKFDGRRGDYTPKNVFEENYVYRTSNPGVIRRDVSFSAIKGLIMRMGGLKEGRKILILVSEGYGGGATVSQDLREIADLASRNNTAIYPVTPRLYPPASPWMPLDLMDGMNVLAEQSGGRTIYESARTMAELRERRVSIGTPKSNLVGAMKQIITDSSAYYLLGYNSTRTVPDGKFHKIEVKVKRPGVQLRYRKGYLAWRPEDIGPTTPARPAAPPSVVETTLAMTATPRGRPVRTWIGMARGENGLTRVTVAWEPLPSVPGEALRDDQRPVRLAVKATGPDAASYFEGRVPEALAEPPAGSHVFFDAPPGTIQLRVSVESAGGTVLDTEVRNVLVADLTAPQTAMGTPEVFRARTLPELQLLKTRTQDTPAATREFSRTERLLIRVPVYGPGGVRPQVSARLLNRNGQPMAQLPATPRDMGAGFCEIEVSLASLAPGDYGVEMIASGESGDASEIVAFRVTN